MEVRKAHPGRSERVDVRGREFGAEGTDIGKAPIVGEQDDDVGTVGRGLGGLRPRRKSADQGGDSDGGSTPGTAYTNRDRRVLLRTAIPHTPTGSSHTNI